VAGVAHFYGERKKIDAGGRNMLRNHFVPKTPNPKVVVFQIPVFS
jgi:hypothetical protein